MPVPKSCPLLSLRGYSISVFTSVVWFVFTNRWITSWNGCSLSVRLIFHTNTPLSVIARASTDQRFRGGRGDRRGDTFVCVPPSCQSCCTYYRLLLWPLRNENHLPHPHTMAWRLAFLASLACSNAAAFVVPLASRAALNRAAGQPPVTRQSRRARDSSAAPNMRYVAMNR